MAWPSGNRSLRMDTPGIFFPAARRAIFHSHLVSTGWTSHHPAFSPNRFNGFSPALVVLQDTPWTPRQGKPLKRLDKIMSPPGPPGLKPGVNESKPETVRVINWEAGEKR